MPNPGREVTPRPKCLRVCNNGRDGGRPDNADPRDGLKPLAFLARTMLPDDPILDRSNQRLQSLKLRCQYRQTCSSINGQAFIPLVRNGRQQLLDPFPTLRSCNTELSQMRKALITWVRCRSSRSRVRCCINRPCCSADLTLTKRMVGRRTASQIASASAASFLLRLT